MSDILGYLPNLDQLLKSAVQRARQIYNPTANAGEPPDEFRGLYISEQEIDSLVDRTQSIGTGESAGEFIDSCAALPGIEAISQHFGLSSFDHAVLLVALAPEIDLRYERIYAYLQDDVSKRKPTVDLALNLLSGQPPERLADRTRFASDAPLLRSGLLHLVPDAAQLDQPLLGQYLKLDDLAVRLLIGNNALDPRLAPFCVLEDNVTAPEAKTDLLTRLSAFVITARKKDSIVRLHFAGPVVGAKEGAAHAVAAALKVPLLKIDLGKSTGWRNEAGDMAAIIVREALRTSAVLMVGGLDLSGDAAAMQQRILQYDGVTIVPSDSPLVAAALKAAEFLTVEFPAPDYDVRRAAWQSEVAEAGLYASPTSISTLAGRFLHGPEDIHAAVESARRNLEWQATADQRPSPDEVEKQLMQAARAQSGGELASLTSKLKPVYEWSDLVLPKDSLDQLNEICQRVAHAHDVLESGGFGDKLSGGKGVAVLFAGPSGTGKTMAAEVVAAKLGLDLYRIDLSMVVSKYIGETEKNLERIFNAATRSNSVLLFDEGDALFGKRSDVSSAHDRYANIEVSYLLQKMDQHEGITILTTNLRGNLDEAFVRRLAFTVHFPFPIEADRLKIWSQVWPLQTKLDPEVRFDGLAKHFKLSGGNIKNIALSTAFLAAAADRPVRMSDILHATRREYEKVGKVMSTAEMEAAVQ